MARTAAPDRQRPGTCRHGTPIATACRSCARQLDADCRAFERDVFFGKYNWRGYTEREWIAAGRSRESWRSARQEAA